MYQQRQRLCFMKSSDKDLNQLRLQVFLSRNGVCSRRKALEIIKEGEITLNGKVCREPSTLVNIHSDYVALEGKTVRNKSYDYVLLNKPAGHTTTKSDPFAQKTVLQLLPRKYQHLSPAGRLDKDTEGLLLFTNDGDLAYQMTHPKHQMDKTYFVRILGRMDMEKKKKVESGVYIDGKKTSPAKIKNIRFFKTSTELMITIHEGRKRQIRYMFAKVGHRVSYLKRLSQGSLSLGTLKKGMWRVLTKKEIEGIKAL